MFRAGVTRQVLAVFPVFNGFGRTAADAGHAVGAALPPYRSSVLQADVVQRTDGSAFSAGDAGICGAELFGVDKDRVKQCVYNAAVDSVLQRYGKPGDRPAVFDEPGGFVGCALGLADYPCCFFLCGRGKHCNVVFRHDYLGAA